MDGLESVYKRHHARDDKRKARKRNHAILVEERVAFIHRYLPKGAQVVDIGCRDGELIKHYNNEGQYQITGLDIDSEALNIAKEKTRITTVWCDLNAEWPIATGSADGVVACEVIEHLYYPEVVLEKISKSLKPGGVLVGSLPHAFNLQTRLKFLFGTKKLTPLADPTHINHVSAAEWKATLMRHFNSVVVIGVTTPRYAWLTPVFPYLFAHTLLFTGVKK
jgi:2-polyprenyl-3-methyl-5-hydroxy-6-metoxy-1,4-benzoquinol methylase